MKGSCTMKKIALILLVCLLCLSLCSCENLLQKAKSAVTGEEIPEMPADYVATLENETYSYELYKTYVKITKYLGEETEVNVPDKIDDLPVTVIGSLCFHDTAAKVTSVNIPSSVTLIDESAFYLAESLVSIVIPDTVTEIGSRAFAWCNALETVVIGAGIAEIPEYCFNHCSSLINVQIPSGVTKIGLRAFSYCDKLEEVTIPMNVTAVGERAFVGCTSLKYVVFENNSVVIGNAMFENTDNVVVIAEESSSGKQYCENNNLRWSTSKDIEAVILGGDNSNVSGLNDASSKN